MYRNMLSAGVLLVLASAPLAAQRPGSASNVPATALTTSVTKTTPKLLPGTRPNVFTTIQGNALSSSNSSLPNALVRLRDARFGRIVDLTRSDQSGLFTFKTVDPGSYIVELVAQDKQSILAASQILNVSAGDIVSAVVKLPFRIPAFAGVLGNPVPSAAAVTTQAAASGVLATSVTQEVSPAR